MNTINHNNPVITGAELDNWFEQLIDTIKVDYFLMKEDIAPAETKEFYNHVMWGNQQLVLAKLRETSSQYFISQILNEYVKELKHMQKEPLQLAVALSDSKILVWAVIDDNDEQTEDALLIAEAKVNGKFHQYGFYLNSTVLEKCDSVSVPTHYQTIIG